MVIQYPKILISSIYLIISLVPLIFYFQLYNLNLYIFDPNLIIQENYIWDEQISYFLKSKSFIEHFSFGVNEINDNFKFHSAFISIITLSILQFLIGDIYFVILCDVLISFIFLIFTHYIFNTYLKFSLTRSIILSFLFLIFFSKGPTTYYFFYNIFLNLTLDSMPHIFRQISPSITTIYFYLYVILSLKFFEKKNYIKYLFFIPFTYFTYPYSSLIQFTISFILMGYIFFNNKNLIKKSLLFLLVNSLSFLIWYMINNFESEWFSKFLFGANYNLIFDFRNFFILVFVFFNLYFFKKTKDKFFVYFNIIFFALFTVYNSKFIIGYDVQLYHVDLYYIEPLQWINIFYYIHSFINKKYDKIIICLIFFIGIFYLISFNNFSKSLLNENLAYIKHQQIYKSELKKIKNILQDKTVISLDPNFIFYGFKTVKAKNYIFYSARNIKISPIENLNRFILTCYLHGYKDFQQIYNLYQSNTSQFSYGKHGVFHELIFLEDGIAGGIKKPYRSIDKNNQNLFEIKTIMKKMYDNLINNQLVYPKNSVLLLHKFDQEYKKYSISNDNILMENNFFKVIEINYE